MIKICDLIVNGFKAKNRTAMVQLRPADYSVIYAENGAGKTSFLRVLTAFLAQDDEVLKEMCVEFIVCHYLDGDSIRAVVVKKDSDDDYDWGDFMRSGLSESSSLSLGVDRGISTQSIKVPPSLINSFVRRSGYRKAFESISSLSNFSKELSIFIRERQDSMRRENDLNLDERHLYLQNIKMGNIEDILQEKYMSAKYMAAHKIQSALFDTLAVAISEVSYQEGDEGPFDGDELYRSLLLNKSRIIEALDDGAENNFKARVVEIISSIESPDTKERIGSSALLRMLLKNIVGELKFEQFLLGAINLLIEKFNGLLIENKKLVVREDKVFIAVDDIEHSLSELSSGERHLLTLLSLVLFVGSDRDFLIIDEPEISLNANWQAGMLDLFSQLIPATQIIVASHSPFIAGKSSAALVELKINRG